MHIFNQVSRGRQAQDLIYKLRLHYIYCNFVWFSDLASEGPAVFAPLPPRAGQRAHPAPTGRTHRARYRTTSAGNGLKNCKTLRPRAPAHLHRAGAALPVLPAARPVKVSAGKRRGPARGPLKTNPARRWAYSSRPSRLIKFRGAQPSSRLCCVTANVRPVTHHARRAGHGQGRAFRAAGAVFGRFGP